MPTRRGLLAAAGIAFCGCCLQGAARAQDKAPARRPVSVAGRQIRTVDAHAHCIFADVLALLGSGAQAPMPPTKGAEEHYHDCEESVIVLDGTGIAMVGGAAHEVGPGDTSWIPPGLPHLFRNASATAELHLLDLCLRHRDAHPGRQRGSPARCRRTRAWPDDPR